VNSITGEVEYTGRVQRRLVLVLDCVVANEFTDKMSDLMNLQHYVIREKRLTEKEAVVIFFDIVRVIDCLHRVCSVLMLFCGILRIVHDILGPPLPPRGRI